MGLDDQVEKMEVRKSYRNVWHTNLLSTISADTPCMHSSLFPHTFSFRSVSSFRISLTGSIILFDSLLFCQSWFDLISERDSVNAL
jgi:hypothetical protein